MSEEFKGRVVNLRMHKKTVFADVIDNRGLAQLLIERDRYDKDPFREGDIMSGEGVRGFSRKGDAIISPTNYRTLVHPHNYRGEDFPERERIKNKATLIGIIRDELEQKGCVETVTPSFWSHPSNAAIDAFETVDREGRSRYLRFTIELELKKICARTQFPLYEIGNVFRNMGLDRRHPWNEYTVVEAVLPYTGLDEAIGVCEKIFRRYTAAQGISPEQTKSVHVCDALAGIPESGWKDTYKKTIRRVQEPTVFHHPPHAWSPLSVNDGVCAADAELVYGTVGLAHICEENNEYESLLHSFREQSRITGKPFASVDPAFLEAIAQGIPPMSGVCIGIDRMMAVVERCKHE